MELLKHEKLIPGISAYNEEIDEHEEESLKERFKAHSKCDLCGVSLYEDIRHSMRLNRRLLNACSMCYYTDNLDRIPSQQKGKVIHFPFMEQPRFNALIRGVWAVTALRKLEPENRELELIESSVSTLMTVIKGQENMTASYFTNVETVIYASLLGLIPKHEYDQRYKLLTNFVWIPDQEPFEKDVAFWIQKDYSVLHDKKISGNITNFMSNYLSEYNLKE